MSKPARKAPAIEPDPVIEAYKVDIDRTLLRENLKRTPDERFRNLIDMQRFFEQYRGVARRAEKPHDGR